MDGHESAEDSVGADIEVEIKLFATFRETVGQRTLSRAVAPGTTVRDLLADLEREYPALGGELLDGEDTPSSVAVLREGALADLDALLDAGDRVSICPPVTGGRR